MSGDPERTQQSRCKNCLSCNLDCFVCSTSTEDENQSLLGKENGRHETPPQSRVISEQPTPAHRETNDEQRETTPQGTKSNQVGPQESASEFSYGKSSSFEDKLEQMRRSMRRRLPNQVKVGIFSRSAESEYDWLKRMLESESFVKSVRPYYISNNGFSEFSDIVSRCDFGILYHTQNRGRVNLTDVTDSLYDEELKELFAKLEKKNVIVVIDDLKDSSEERKNEILKEQPKLKSLATDVFLFTGDQKKVMEEK
ncbi:uncharacterized protein [Phyllobates terribilis]|uniref:uncharacterized protein isoform X2 n=1 Tax=Phyllobates terribilis TaxID=111132 RepID=UPI003CCB18A4